jgi:succinate dehydrogenase/fumarate reductase-like Fe-S protein
MAAEPMRTAQKLDGLYECILCACMLDIVPELLVEQRPKYLGPAALLASGSLGEG